MPKAKRGRRSKLSRNNKAILGGAAVVGAASLLYFGTAGGPKTPGGPGAGMAISGDKALASTQPVLKNAKVPTVQQQGSTTGFPSESPFLRLKGWIFGNPDIQTAEEVVKSATTSTAVNALPTLVPHPIRNQAAANAAPAPPREIRPLKKARLEFSPAIENSTPINRAAGKGFSVMDLTTAANGGKSFTNDTQSLDSLGTEDRAGPNNTGGTSWWWDWLLPGDAFVSRPSRRQEQSELI